jgi:hypothetical protein
MNCVRKAADEDQADSMALHRVAKVTAGRDQVVDQDQVAKAEAPVASSLAMASDLLAMVNDRPPKGIGLLVMEIGQHVRANLAMAIVHDVRKPNSRQAP